MKRFIPLLLICIIQQAHSQELTPVFEDTVLEGSRLSMTSFNYYSSNSFDNEFMDKFIFGGQITSELKDRNAARLKNVNTFGGEAEQSLVYYNGNLNALKKERYGFMFSFSDNHLVSGNVTSDLFNVGMYGNANYLNDTLDFSFSHILYQHYQKYGFGIFEKSTLSSIQISYVSGSSALEGRLSNTEMYSTEDSTTLALQGGGFSTERFSPYLGFQGSGFAVDLNYNFKFDSKKGKAQIINLKIKNLGLIVWNQASNTYRVDSTTRYTGFNVQDLINQPEGSSKQYNFIDTLGVITGNSTNVGALPIEFSLEKLPIRNAAQKLQYLVGFKTILTSDFFPYFYGGVYYSPIKDLAISSRLSYGGFAGFRMGLNVNYWIKDKVYLGLGTFDLIGNVSKKFGFGRGFNFSAHFNL